MEIMVSILTAAYNHAPYIAQALDSFIAQKTDFPFEVIVHDDASTDGTAEIIREYAQKYPEIIRPILQSENQYSKRISPFFYMDKLIRGKYIAVCEGDDYWCDENKLQKQVAYMENHPECRLCICNSYDVDVDGNILGTKELVMESRIYDTKDILSSEGGLCATAGILYRNADDMEFCKSPLSELQFGDLPLICYLALRGTVYAFKEKMVCYRRFVPGSWTMEVQKNADPEVILQWKNDLLTMYKVLREQTDERFHAILDGKIRDVEFYIHTLKGDYRSMRKPEYRDRFAKIPRKQRIIAFIKDYFPMGVKVFRFLRYGKEGLKKKY